MLYLCLLSSPRLILMRTWELLPLFSSCAVWLKDLELLLIESTMINVIKECARKKGQDTDKRRKHEHVEWSERITLSLLYSCPFFFKLWPWLILVLLAHSLALSCSQGFFLHILRSCAYLLSPSQGRVFDCWAWTTWNDVSVIVPVVQVSPWKFLCTHTRNPLMGRQ